MKDIRNYSLKEHNTFGIEARCKRYIEYINVEEAKEAARILREERQPFLIIGAGSNLLLTGDFDGTVVRSALQLTDFDEKRLFCGSGVVWDDFVEHCLQYKFYGAENLSLIPGDVGAVAVQNIGAYGVEAKDIIERVWAVEIATGELKLFSREECEYAYRWSKFKGAWRSKYLITQVDFQLSREFRPHLEYGNIRQELERRNITSPSPEQLRQVIIDIRRAKLPDPKELGNAGSFFMNPVVSRAKYEELAARYDNMPHYYLDEEHEKIPAGWMIEQCGWRGRSLGQAAVYDRQALVLVNKGGATGQDILRLCHAIQHDVNDKFGIDLQPEVNIV
jgi:UDP-N-acetylmuramate dehydrogenase